MKALLTFSSMELRSSLPKDAGADAGDKEDPESLKVEVAIQSPGQHLLGGDDQVLDLNSVIEI